MKKNPNKLTLSKETLRDPEASKVTAGQDSPTVNDLTCVACGLQTQDDPTPGHPGDPKGL
jgi:hypothetical protein